MLVTLAQMTTVLYYKKKSTFFKKPVTAIIHRMPGQTFCVIVVIGTLKMCILKKI